jgi:hypothetical protein
MKRRFKATIYLEVETSSDRLTSKQGRHAAIWQCAEMLGTVGAQGGMTVLVKSFEEVEEVGLIKKKLAARRGE